MAIAEHWGLLRPGFPVAQRWRAVTQTMASDLADKDMP